MIDDVKCTGHQISVTFSLFIVEWIQMLSFTPKSFPFIKFKKKQEKTLKKRPFFLTLILRILLLWTTKTNLIRPIHTWNVLNSVAVQ